MLNLRDSFTIYVNYSKLLNLTRVRLKLNFTLKLQLCSGSLRKFVVLGAQFAPL